MPDHLPQMLVMLMWTISSDDVHQAKERIDRRRAEVETRYTAEKNALAGEFAAIEALERIAAEFALRHSGEDAATTKAPVTANIETPTQATAVEPEPEHAEPAEYGGPAEARADPEAESAAAADIDPSGSAEPNLAFDILKPGSRWRLNRAARLLNPEGAPVTPPASYPPASN
jgi:hypothetical protein